MRAVDIRGRLSTHIWHAQPTVASPASTLYLDMMTSITEITFVTGGRCRVEGEAKDVERVILDAARGSLMQLAWLTDAKDGEPLAINPACVVMLRALTPSRSSE
jgi:hypothetical protein